MEINIIIKNVFNYILNIKEISNLIWTNRIFQKFHIKKILLFIIIILFKKRGIWKIFFYKEIW
jgi:hypothetical protein